MKTVTELQSGMQFKGAEDSIDITSGEGLENLNNVYRAVAAELPWPELMREDTSIVTTSASRYTWPDQRFLDVKMVEIQDGDDNNLYKAFWPPADMASLSIARRRKAKSVPDHYFRMSTAALDQIELVPAPKYSGKIVRITGIIEPGDLGGQDDPTVFLLRVADDAIEWLLAGMYYERDGFGDRAQVCFRNAQQIFQRLFGKELVPDELIRRIVPPPPGA